MLAVHELQKTSSGFTGSGQIAVSIAFAFALIAAVYTVADLSGAHINPAITAGLAAVGRFPWRMVPAYVAAQLTGALLAALANWAIFLALPISGGSLNPTRTLGPDIVAAKFPYWWIYIVGPVAGAIVGAALWELVLGKGSKQAALQAAAPASKRTYTLRIPPAH